MVRTVRDRHARNTCHTRDRPQWRRDQVIGRTAEGCPSPSSQFRWSARERTAPPANLRVRPGGACVGAPEAPTQAGQGRRRSGAATARAGPVAPSPTLLPPPSRRQHPRPVHTPPRGQAHGRRSHIAGRRAPDAGRPTAAHRYRPPQVTSASAKPRLAGQQPPSAAGCSGDDRADGVRRRQARTRGAPRVPRTQEHLRCRSPPSTATPRPVVPPTHRRRHPLDPSSAASG